MRARAADGGRSSVISRRSGVQTTDDRRLRTARFALLVVVCLCASGCSSGYVVRAAYEEARLLWRRQPIDRVLAGDVDPATRAKLELTLAVRRFAQETLGLSVGGSYRSIATVDASQVVHVVTAAPRDQLVPYTWWFPIVGRVPYRAYFDQTDADGLAATLEGEGYDTYVRPAVAFSTLGWFDDPLLSNLLRYDDERLADTIIHELLHNTIYVPGQTAFNESFATFVGQRGAEAFFLAADQPARARDCAARWADALTYSAFLDRLITELQAAYAAGVRGADRDTLFERARAEFTAQPWQTREYAGFKHGPLNNAVILHDQLYADRLQVFEAAYRRQGDDLKTTVAWIRETVQDHSDPFAALQSALDGGAAAVAGAGVPQGSIASSRRMPCRIEPISTATISTTTASSDAATLACVAGVNGTCVKRLEKIA
jgi:predicted aminopeptidase